MHIRTKPTTQKHLSKQVRVASQAARTCVTFAGMAAWPRTAVLRASCVTRESCDSVML